jgi:hypothetical protein
VLVRRAEPVNVFVMKAWHVAVNFFCRIPATIAIEEPAVAR